jgi:hypothetical protein
VERGLLLDEAPILLLEWEVRSGDAPEPPTRVAFLGEGVEEGDARRLLAHPEARARMRASRGAPYPNEAFLLRISPALAPGAPLPSAGQAGAPHPVLSPALAALDDALLGPLPESDPEIPGGWPTREDEAHLLPLLRGAPTVPPPTLLEPAGWAEYGLAALFTGRWGAARAILAGWKPGRASPLPFVLLAARWSLWTARPVPLAGAALDALLEAARDEARDEREGGPAQAGAAFPPLPRVLEELADGLEGLSDPSRPARLRRWAEELRLPPTSPPGTPGGTAPPALRLPVLGSPIREERPAPRPLRATLPPPGAFAPVDAPAILSRRTLHAARLVRSWVEGILGVEPDASVGRLTLGIDLRALGDVPPDPPDTPGGRAPPGSPDGPLDPVRLLEVENLRVGDARVALQVEGVRGAIPSRPGQATPGLGAPSDCRRGWGALTFRVAQEAGRVPLNLVLKVRLPLPRISRVRMGDERVEVEVRETEEGTLLQCQFPLDPERRIIVEAGD